MDPERKLWNLGQQELRQALARPEQTREALRAFQIQHAKLHTARMAQSGLYSFEDESLSGLSEEQVRLIPRNMEHSIAWVLWHISRIEDATMNLLVAGTSQVLLREGWLARLHLNCSDTGNGSPAASIKQLSAGVDLQALRAYRLSVGHRTREIVQHLQPGQLKQRVDPARLDQMRLEGVVLDSASDLLEYWGGLNIAGLLLMPPTRHIFVHWNEVLRIKRKFS